MFMPENITIQKFDVTSTLPAKLERLKDIASNFWWSWSPLAQRLFAQVDAELWESTHHNPVRLLGLADQARLNELASDAVFTDQVDRAWEALDRHVTRQPWIQQKHGDAGDFTVAYFCAEFGITECFQIYSGGLGCLAGDHLKSASELGLPLVAVGLLYRHGYFQQYLSHEGWQQEYFPELDFDQLPIETVCNEAGDPLTVRVDLPGRVVEVGVWKARVGRIDLFLLDTDLPSNTPQDRSITGQLYGGDMETRIQQEIVLGIGGNRALLAMGIEPDVCHLNEGHAAFVALERIRNLIAKHDLTFDQARQQAAASHLFTTHTPVPAGIDRFPSELVKRYFTHYHDGLRLDMEGMLALGRDDVFDRKQPFSMATLAIRTSDWCNGVSALHGEVSRDMWKDIWPQVPIEEVPIGHVTNGCHVSSYLSPEMADLIDSQAGEGRRRQNPTDYTVFEAVYDVPDDQFWAVHQERRRRLIAYAADTHRRRPPQLGPARQLHAALDPNALTVGFARRFATYKRGTLFLSDAPRLLRLLRDPDRPVQFVIAGKAHPADHAGKELIQQIVQFAEAHDVSGRILFLENYDIQVARYLVQGCDIWLNTPRRGMEASGTSGMKSAINGIPNCSILDGWWDEGYTPDVGWAIGHRETYDDPATADRLESRALYELLEQGILPEFYQRDAAGLPTRWVRRMKDSIAGLAPFFNTNRMVQEYAESYYLPALQRARRLGRDDLKPAVQLADAKDELRSAWSSLHIEHVEIPELTAGLKPGAPIDVFARVHLGSLKPEQLHVEVCHGPVGVSGQLTALTVARLTPTEQTNGLTRFEGRLKPVGSGRHGLAVRIVPSCDIVSPVHEPGLILWHGQPVARPRETTLASASPMA